MKTMQRGEQEANTASPLLPGAFPAPPKLPWDAEATVTQRLAWARPRRCFYHRFLH